MKQPRHAAEAATPCAGINRAVRLKTQCHALLSRVHGILIDGAQNGT